MRLLHTNSRHCIIALTFPIIRGKMRFIDKWIQILVNMKWASFKGGQRYARLLAFTARVISQ